MNSSAAEWASVLDGVCRPPIRNRPLLPDTIQKMPNEIYAAFDTTEGKFKIKLFADKVPNTVNNFVTLADGTKTGKPFYDGTVFHRVIPDFMIQGGAPEGTGRGGPGYRFEDELKANPNKHKKGSLSM